MTDADAKEANKRRVRFILRRQKRKEKVNFDTRDRCYARYIESNPKFSIRIYWREIQIVPIQDLRMERFQMTDQQWDVVGKT